MKILIFGSSSFAATGLREALESEGHEVWTFDRGRSFDASRRSLRGPYDQLDRVTETMGSCDAVVNFALVKFGGLAENLDLTRQILACARALRVSRFLHISSISVLPSDRPEVDESTPAADHPHKGEYSRVKVAAENLVRAEWTGAGLQVLRPGFILADGILDPMVGMGRLLPTGHVMGMGSRRTLIPLVTREAIHRAIGRILGMPASAGAPQTFMAVMPQPPRRDEYLRFMCHDLGRGRGALHFPGWLWRAGLMAASLPLSILRRRWLRLDRTFEHNLRFRAYNCRQTEEKLGLSFDFDWKRRLLEIEGRDQNAAWPSGAPASGTDERGNRGGLAYYGLGRISVQRHLPALARLKYSDPIGWRDPAIPEPPRASRLTFLPAGASLDGSTHSVITAPCHLRSRILAELPATVTQVLLEKPLAGSAAQLAEVTSRLEGRDAFVLHNYRFKPNTLALRRHLLENPPGRLIRAALHFESPSPANEMVAWMRSEREHRILLTDYGMHFVDLALLFCEGPMRINRCDVVGNRRNEVESISADLSFDNAPCSLLLRQGCHRRQCAVTYDFQNYSVQLGFFPDVFAAIYGGRGPADDLRLACRGALATGAKILEKLRLAVVDRSHEIVLGSFLGIGERGAIRELSLQALAPFYDRLTRLADHVYGRDPS